ncbi:hypothetical protein K2X33_12150 [bacterium]|nr:hypothetical protein [bacterium]
MKKLFLGIFFITASAQSFAVDNEYALTCFQNDTGSRIYFKIYDSAGWSKMDLIASYATYAVWHRYSYANENRSPYLYMQVDTDLTNNAYYQTFQLTRYARPSKECNGAVDYRFQYENGNTNYLRLSAQ